MSYVLLFIVVIVVSLLAYINPADHKDTDDTKEVNTSVAATAGTITNSNNRVFSLQAASTADWDLSKEGTALSITNKGTKRVIIYDVVVNDYKCPTALFDKDTLADNNESITYKLSCPITAIDKIEIISNTGKNTFSKDDIS